MALTDETNTGNGMIMPVQPMGGYYGGMPYGGGFGGGMFGNGNDWLGLLFLIAICNGGFGGFGFGGGYGAMMGAGMMGGMWGMDYLYPWLNNSQNINDGFRDQQLAIQVNGIQNAITSGFGDVQLGIAGVNQNICQTGNGITNAVNQGFASTNLGIANGTAAIQNSLCNGFNGVNNSVFAAQTAIGQQLNANELANLNRSFAEQTANQQGFNSMNAGVADLRYTVATEACADRAAVGDALQNVTMQNMGNTNVLVTAIRDGIQSIKDDLCADRLANAQRETEAERRENANLRSQLSMAQLAASQAAQTATFQQGLNNEVDALYNRLKNCPVNTVPVYGNQPIFTCPQTASSCGCNGGF